MKRIDNLKLMAKILEMLLSLFITLFTILFFIQYIINFKPLYYYDTLNLNLIDDFNTYTQEYNINVEPLNSILLKKNYEYMISYINGNYSNNFSLPTIPSSNSGREHFKDVRALINRIRYLMLLSTLFIVISILICKKNGLNSYLKWSGIELLLIALVSLIMAALNFSVFFDYFHKVFFNNDFWIFDPRTDPIILLLPEEFFMHCGEILIGGTLITGIAFLIIDKLKNRVQSTRYKVQ